MPPSPYPLSFFSLSSFNVPSHTCRKIADATWKICFLQVLFADSPQAIRVNFPRKSPWPRAHQPKTLGNFLTKFSPWDSGRNPNLEPTSSHTPASVAGRGWGAQAGQPSRGDVAGGYLGIHAAGSRKEVIHPNPSSFTAGSYISPMGLFFFEALGVPRLGSPSHLPWNQLWFRKGGAAGYNVINHPEYKQEFVTKPIPLHRLAW